MLLHPILHAGPFSMMYENGFIRYIRYGQTEIIRMIYVTLRIENWETCEYSIENESIHRDDSAFTVTYTCFHKKGGLNLFKWEVHITGSPSGQIRFSIAGHAMQDFQKNRAGFCILHPIANTEGNQIIVSHENGRTTKGIFPDQIAPVCPFTGIQKMQWENSGNQYVIEMKGDLFEMEDHRNWTDNSFKTYCTLQHLPYPVKLMKGHPVAQEIIFYPVDSLKLPDQTDEAAILQIELETGQGRAFPSIGVGSSTEFSSLSKPAEIGIQEAGFDFYNVHIKTINPEWKAFFQQEIQINRTLQLNLFIVLELTNDFRKELQDCEILFTPILSEIKYVLLLTEGKPVTSQELAEFGPSFIRRFLPGTKTGVGTNTNFAELNRNIVPGKNFDFVNYSIHPQEHAFDNLTMIENLEAQGKTIRSANMLYPYSDITVSAVTLRKRQNPYAKHPADIILSNDKKADPRQTELWAAGWTLGSLKYLLEGGISAVSYFQTIGKQGIADESGNLYPAGILLKKVLALKKGKILKTGVSKPLYCSSFLISAENKNYLFVANHRNTPQLIKTPMSFSTVEIIEEGAAIVRKALSVKQDQIRLNAFGVYILS